MKGTISVVIPVYNVEKYLSECLDSVINQTYTNLQIILVDDGSTDNSGKICDAYAEKDSRIQVIHQENQGAGGAKNTGLDYITGDYFSLIDSDDYLDLCYYEKMLSAITENDVDVAQCLFYSVYKNNMYSRNYNFPCSKSRKIKVEIYLSELLSDWKYAIFWNKLFKTSLFTKDIRFPIGRKIDDEFFTYKLICKARKIININDRLYFYRMRRSSVMGSSDSEKLVGDRIDCFFDRLFEIKNTYPGLANEYSLHLFSYVEGQLNNDSLSKEFKQKQAERISGLPKIKETVFQKVKQKILLSKYNPDNNSHVTNEEEFFD